MTFTAMTEIGKKLQEFITNQGIVEKNGVGYFKGSLLLENFPTVLHDLYLTLYRDEKPAGEATLLSALTKDCIPDTPEMPDDSSFLQVSHAVDIWPRVLAETMVKIYRR